MKRLLTLLFALVVFAALGWLAYQDPGFITVGWNGWVLESSLSWFLALLIAGFIILSILWKLLNLFWQIPHRLWQIRTVQREQKAQESLLQAILAMLQERWKTAEQLLVKTAERSESPAIHYIGAAYTAYQLRDGTRATEYLEQAQKTLPTKEMLALILFQMKLQRQQQNYPAALRHALHAHELEPKREDVLFILLTLYLQLVDWVAVLELLPEIHKYRVLSTEQIQSLEQRAYIALLKSQFKSSQVIATWESIAREMRFKARILKPFIQQLVAVGDITTAETMIREALKYTWDQELVALYGQLQTTHLDQQINQAEIWLKTYNTDATLLSTLGYLCARNRLWEKAKFYFQASLQQRPDPQIHAMLAEVLSQLDELAEANVHYRQSLPHLNF